MRQKIEYYETCTKNKVLQQAHSASLSKIWLEKQLHAATR